MHRKTFHGDKNEIGSNKNVVRVQGGTLRKNRTESSSYSRY